MLEPNFDVIVKNYHHDGFHLLCKGTLSIVFLAGENMQEEKLSIKLLKVNLYFL